MYLCLNSQEEFFCVLIPGVQPANPSDHKRGKGAKRSMINEPSSPLPRMHLQERHHCGAVGTLQQCGFSKSKFYAHNPALFTANSWANSALAAQPFTQSGLAYIRLLDVTRWRCNGGRPHFVGRALFRYKYLVVYTDLLLGLDWSFLLSST